MDTMSDKYITSLDQGATWARTITWKDTDGEPYNLTGYTARMSLKSGGVTALSLTTENGRITLGGDTGIINLVIDAGDAEGLPAGSYAYDLELVSGDETPWVTRLLEGFITVIQNTTT